MAWGGGGGFVGDCGFVGDWGWTGGEAAFVSLSLVWSSNGEWVGGAV